MHANVWLWGLSATPTTWGHVGAIRTQTCEPLHEGLDARKRVIVGPYGNAHHEGAIRTQT